MSKSKKNKVRRSQDGLVDYDFIVYKKKQKSKAKDLRRRRKRRELERGV